VGGQYTLPQTTLNAEVEGGYFGKSRRGELNYYEERQENGILEKGDFTSYDDYDNYKKFIKPTIGFAHKFDEDGKHKLSGSGFFQYDWRSLEYFQSDLLGENRKQEQGHRAWEDEYHTTGKANVDYIYPYRETGVLEAGYQFYSYLEDGDYAMKFYDHDRQIFYDREDIYNLFYFQEGIHSAYAIVSDRLRDFQFQAGVRGEHTHRALRSSIAGKDRTFNRLEFFPSVHFGYYLTENQQILASYSRRTTRPDLFYMEPYITYRDYYTAEIGNPDVRPEYINSFEVSYKNNIAQHAVAATVFYRSRKDKIERLRIPYVAGVTLDSMANVGHDYSLGVELNAQIQATRRWSMNANGSFYRYEVENKLKDFGGSDEKSNNYEFAWTNTFEATKNTRIQLDANFVGPSVTTQGKTEAFQYVNFSVRQQFWNHKLAATLAFRDMFNTARYTSIITTANLKSTTHIRPQYPLISLTLNYTFNNYTDKRTKEKENHDLFEGTNH
jgi:outer membrane receptor protein involved in Fe transport